MLLLLPVLQRGPRVFTEILSTKEVKLNHLEVVKHRGCSWHLAAPRRSMAALPERAWQCPRAQWRASFPLQLRSKISSRRPHARPLPGLQSSAHSTSPTRRSPALTAAAGEAALFRGRLRTQSCKPMQRAAFPSPHLPAACTSETRPERNHENKAGGSAVSVPFIAAKEGPCLPGHGQQCPTGKPRHLPGAGVRSTALARISSLVSHPRSPKSTCQGRRQKSLT